MPPVMFFRYSAAAGGDSGATPFQWISTTDGNWSDTTKWSTGTVPDSNTVTPDFTKESFGEPLVITMSDIPRTVAGLKIGAPYPYTRPTVIAGTQPLTLSTSTGTTPEIDGRGATISLRLFSTQGITIKNADVFLTNNANSIVGPINIVSALWLKGAGVLRSGTISHDINLSGTLDIASSAGMNLTGALDGGGRLSISQGAGAVTLAGPLGSLGGGAALGGGTLPGIVISAKPYNGLAISVPAGVTRTVSFGIGGTFNQLLEGYTDSQFCTKTGLGVVDFTYPWESSVGLTVAQGAAVASGGVPHIPWTGSFGPRTGQPWQVNTGTTLSWTGGFGRELRVQAGGQVQISENTKNLMVSGTGVTFAGVGTTAGTLHVGYFAGSSAAPVKTQLTLPVGRTVNVYARGRFVDWYGYDWKRYTTVQWGTPTYETGYVGVGINDFTPSALYLTGGIINLKPAVEGGSGSTDYQNSNAYMQIGGRTLNAYGYLRATSGAINYNDPVTPGTATFPTVNTPKFDVSGGYSVVDFDGVAVSFAPYVTTTIGDVIGATTTRAPACVNVRSGSINLGGTVRLLNGSSDTTAGKPFNALNILGGTLACTTLSLGATSLVSIAAGAELQANRPGSGAYDGFYSFEMALTGGKWSFPQSGTWTASTAAVRVHQTSVLNVPAGKHTTLVMPFVSPTGSVVSHINVTNGGSGYIGAPTVLITGGAGSKAYAVATVGLDPADTATYGKVTGVTVTSPGTGYGATDVVAVSFVGGGGSGATAVAVLAPANASATLRKEGAGTLVYNGTGSTLSGEIVAAEGKLIMATADQLSIRTAPGSTLVISRVYASSGGRRTHKRLILDGGTFVIGGPLT